MTTTTHPFASPNAIPPRTSSTGQVTNAHPANPRHSVLRPLSEIDWMSQSKKSKTSHASIDAAASTQPRPHSQPQSQSRSDPMSLEEISTNYPTPLSPPSDAKNLGED